ncbi:ABC transporter permease [Pseudolysinimonas sp.]|uniref:ABC transporter permease n=1 Tax=Pseudolysinimonas sp. TaxID=2680009 RepID=UPI003F818099
MIFVQAFAWILDGSHWLGAAGGGHPAILQRIGETLGISLVSVVIVVVIALPLGVLIGHTGRGRTAAILASNVARALPTLGLLSILLLAIGINSTPIVIVLVVLGIPPMLAGAYAGLEAVDRTTIDAARALGMTEWQIILRVEIPLAAGLIVGGFRSTVLQVIATTTVASAFAFGGLGIYLINGLAQNDFVQLLAGAILVTVLCLIIDGLLALVQRLVAPRGVPRDPTDSASPKKGRRASRLAAATGPTPLQEGMQS